MAERTCLRCPNPLPPTKRPDLQKYCSQECARPTKLKPQTCTQCGVEFMSRYGWEVCSPGCRLLRDRASLRASHLRHGSSSYRSRARRFGGKHEPLSRADIYERDGWRCGICGDLVDSRLSHPHPQSASLDHVVPLSLGGDHTPENVQCSHLICNVEKGNRIFEPDA